MFRLVRRMAVVFLVTSLLGTAACNEAESSELSPEAADAFVYSILDDLTCRELASLGLRASNEQLLAIKRRDQEAERLWINRQTRVEAAMWRHEC